MPQTHRQYNILFFHGDETCPQMGGIQRTTARIAEELTKRFGHKCFSIFNKEPYAPDVPRYEFEKTIRLPYRFTAEDIASVINDNHIDIIINQMMVDENTILSQGIKMSGHSCRLLYCHHNTPRRLWDYSLNGTFKSFKYRKRVTSFLIGCLMVALHPVVKQLKKRRTLRKNAADYERIYQESDKFILLSKRFYPELLEMTALPDTAKLSAIPNMLSFERFASETTLKNKEKRILLVARLEEFPKMVSWALKIWHEITKDKRFDDWQFDIVGHGSDEEYLRNLIVEKETPRATMHGRQDSEPFFERDSIFIMTSIREGFPMTLVEASQKGCVPIAFDSFASVRDIITDGENGILVKPFDLGDFVGKLKALMANDKMREDMARRCINDSKRYIADNVMQQWQTLLD